MNWKTIEIIGLADFAMIAAVTLIVGIRQIKQLTKEIKSNS